MDIDIRTFVLIFGIAHLMPVLMFYRQYKINKTNKKK